VTEQLAPGVLRQSTAFRLRVVFGSCILLLIWFLCSRCTPNGISSTLPLPILGRLFGWLSLCVAADSTINYTMDMVGSNAGFRNELSITFFGSCILLLIWFLCSRCTPNGISSTLPLPILGSEKGYLGPEIRPFGWLSLCVAADSTINYTMDMVGDRSQVTCCRGHCQSKPWLMLDDSRDSRKSIESSYRTQGFATNSLSTCGSHGYHLASTMACFGNVLGNRSLAIYPTRSPGIVPWYN
jgi:hypothetical protein